jgi:hypothetical protein
MLERDEVSFVQLSIIRHCEERRDEAIQRQNLCFLDCFASLAMTEEISATSIQSNPMPL